LQALRHVRQRIGRANPATAAAVLALHFAFGVMLAAQLQILARLGA
jgi:hypothetical protein